MGIEMFIRSNARKVKRQNGFTLIELLVVIAILGVLAGVTVPNIARFIGHGREGVGDAELLEMQNCVVAAMAATTVTPEIASAPRQFGNVSEDPISNEREDLPVGDKQLSDFIVGGIIRCLGHYQVEADGTVIQLWYPGK